MINSTEQILIAFAIWSVVQIAAAEPITDVVTLGNKKWAQVDLFVNLSWNDINAVCPAGNCDNGNGNTLNGYNMAGWTWASLAEVGTHIFSLVENFEHATGFPVAVARYPNSLYFESFISDTGFRRTRTAVLNNGEISDRILELSGFVSDTIGTFGSGFAQATGSLFCQDVSTAPVGDCSLQNPNLLGNVSWFTTSDAVSGSKTDGFSNIGGWFYKPVAAEPGTTRLPLPAPALSVLAVLLISLTQLFAGTKRTRKGKARNDSYHW